MEFSPFNNVVKLCLQGINFEDKGSGDEAGKKFLQAWQEASNDFEKFLAAHFVARHQINILERLNWCQTALQHALIVNNDSVKTAYSSLYINIAKCYEDLHDLENAKKNYELGSSFIGKASDKGPFYHGTKANLQVGQFLTAGYESNYKSQLIMNHIYFTALLDGASLAAALAKGDGQEHIYIVEPSGEFENDPNVTDKKFPGNLTRSYRTQAPLKIIGDISDSLKQMPEEIQNWREKLASNKGEIFN